MGWPIESRSKKYKKKWIGRIDSGKDTMSQWHIIELENGEYPHKKRKIFKIQLMYF